MLYFSIQGVKKGHKKYKERQAQKERKILEELKAPAIEDPSRELDLTCQAESDYSKQSQSSSSRINRAGSTSSNSTTTAEDALENDPEFQQYMERHKQLYLQNQRGLTSPPAYDASASQGRTSDNQMATASNMSELPAAVENQAPVEIGGKHVFDSRQPVEADSKPVVFELPGDLPAMIPESHPPKT